MPKRGGSLSFFPRRKEEGDGPEGPRTRHVSVDYEALEGLFHLPLKDAARELGLCQTTFKKACRGFNVDQWPFRKAHRNVSHRERKAHTDGVDTAFNTQPQKPYPFGAVCSSAAPQGLLHQASMTLDTRSYGEARHAGPEFQHKTFDGWPCLDTWAFQDKTFAPLSAPSCIDSLTMGTFAPLEAPSSIDSLPRGRVFVGMPIHQPSEVDQLEAGACSSSWGGAFENECAARGNGSTQSSMWTASQGWWMPDCGGGATPLEAWGAPPRRVERPSSGHTLALPSQRQLPEHAAPQGWTGRAQCGGADCVEAVMAYLDGSLAGNFDFVFAAEEGV
eukprot:CAMPEP_0180203086 /NCGR_PEP_ID=MMETSP0987-20121128/7659_1 /TAXON_ID=697907 /ORGANISM="non described non described, Strain CCMP2293" /LENGTH=331 /DNA_ID=CAMNT_0022158423 /DNA_START=218 /DNA_END=1213 /DNA_ORIENTATION=+